MRRLRFTAQQYSILRPEFTEAAHARRLPAWERIAANPGLALPLQVPTRGPFGLPGHAFEQPAWDALLN